LASANYLLRRIAALFNEKDGTDDGKRMASNWEVILTPFRIISEDEINKLLNCVIVAPITTRKPGRRIYPNEVLLPALTANMPNESIVLCHQIRTIHKRRIGSVYGAISDVSIQTEIIHAICFQLGIFFPQ